MNLASVLSKGLASVNEKPGTEWTEPGQGAKGYELLYALQDAVVDSDGQIVASKELGRSLWEQKDRQFNLRLTGQALTPDDIKRIAEAK